MSAQNCQARLLFSEFELTIDYTWNAELSYVWAVAPDPGGGSPIPLWATLKDNYDGTWGHKVPKLDFTKRELSCGNWMARAKQNATDGWVHKSFDFPVMRDFSADYPFATKGATEGYVYYASQKIGDFEPEVGKPNQLPLVNYYALQKYPNQGTPNPDDPEKPPIPPPPESVPLLQKFRNRQPVLPLLNNLQEGNINYITENLWAPFYYLITESGDPLEGYPPNWPTFDEQLPTPESKFVFELTPNKAVFDSRDEYQEWLAMQLGNTSSPIYFPGAPNDPMLFDYDTLVETDEEKLEFSRWRATQSDAPKTLFATEKKWTDFLKDWQNRASQKTPCGGVQQCGLRMSLVNDPEKAIDCTSTADFQTAEGGPNPPEKPWTGTAKITGLITDGLLGKGPWRSADRLKGDSPLKISAQGQIQYGAWQPRPLPQSPPPFYGFTQALNFGFLDPYGYAAYPYDNQILPFFNLKQKGCQQFHRALENIGIPIEWVFTQMFVNYSPFDSPFSDVEGWPPGTAGAGLSIPDAPPWCLDVPVEFTQTEEQLTWEATASNENSGDGYSFKGDASLKLTIKFKDR